MTHWSPWLTDPGTYGTFLLDGAHFWIGTSDLTSGLDTPQQTYHPALGNRTSDVFAAYASSYRGSSGGASAVAVTIGADLSWLTDTANFPDVWDPSIIPPTLAPKWAGNHQFIDTHGTLYTPAGVTVGVGAVVDDLGNPQTATPDILVWLDDSITWTTGSRMQGPVWDPSARTSRWSASVAHERHAGAPNGGVSVTIPVSEVASRGYRVAVTFALDLDVPAGGGPAGADYKLQHQSHLAAALYQNPQFRIDLTTLPALRQYPRNDALGGAPRQGATNGSTSVQASTRQGWTNTYR